jgi:uncharacterized membrane-anchored protein
MDDIQNKISALLNDPAGMEKVMTIAKSLGAGEAKAGSANPAHDKAPQAESIGSLLPDLGNTGDMMKALTSIDPKILNGMTKLFHEYNKPDDRNVLLLRALQPYLRAERRGKMDQAVNILKLAYTARVALETFGGER